MDKELYLVRHGITAWNVAQKFQGHSDIPLSDDGRAQARAVALRLAGVPLDRIVSSDLLRAFETAQAIAQGRSIAVERDIRLRERNFGVWEGLAWPEIVERYPAVANVEFIDPDSYVPEGGEHFSELIARVRTVLDEVQTRPERSVMLVAHAGCIHAMLYALFGAETPSRGVRLHPGSVTHLTFEDGAPRVVFLNEAPHL